MILSWHLHLSPLSLSLLFLSLFLSLSLSLFLSLSFSLFLFLSLLVRHYELSKTHHREVPRMLFECGQIDNLGKYVRTQDDPKLYKWWGQYCEYRGDLANARQYYTRAKDFLALVRVHCHDQDFENAADVVVRKTKKPHTPVVGVLVAGGGRCFLIVD
jgi:hypothetical protein